MQVIYENNTLQSSIIRVIGVKLTQNYPILILYSFILSGIMSVLGLIFLRLVLCLIFPGNFLVRKVVMYKKRWSDCEISHKLYENLNSLEENQDVER